MIPVRIIDFAFTGPGHVLKDLAKMENTLLFEYTPLLTREDEQQALLITQVNLSPLPSLSPPISLSVYPCDCDWDCSWVHAVVVYVCVYMCVDELTVFTGHMLWTLPAVLG